MTRRAGYVVLMRSDANKTIEGILASNTGVPLAPGWNLVGYPSNVTLNMSDSLLALNTTVTQVATFDRSQQIFVYYPGALTQTTPGLGYWINATSSVTWSVTP